MREIEIYTTRFCPYCHAAKRLLARKGVDFTEIDVSGDSKGRSDMVARASGRSTVPQIFVGSTHVGGYDELYALETSDGIALSVYDPDLAAQMDVAEQIMREDRNVLHKLSQ